MGSARTFCDLYVVLLVGLCLVYAQDKKPTVPKGNCTCGGFPTETPDPTAKPVLAQSPGLVIKCDQEGKTSCKDLCTALACATKAKGPELLCAKLVNAEELKLSAFYKGCDGPWTFANMTAEQPLCCENSKVKVCASAQAANATTPVTGKP